jgi:hypothetical protein
MLGSLGNEGSYPARAIETTTASDRVDELLHEHSANDRHLGFRVGLHSLD